MELVKLIDLIEKPLSGEWGTEDENGNGVPVIRTANFTDEGIIDYSKIVTRNIPENKVIRKSLKTNDIIIEKSGGTDTKPVGRVVFFDGESDKYLFNNFTAVLRVKNIDIVKPRYLFLFLFNFYWHKGTSKYENKTTGIHNLKLDQLLNEVKVPIVSAEKQEEIITIIDKAINLKNDKTYQIGLLDELVKARFVEMFGDRFDGERIKAQDIASPLIGLTYKPDNVCDDGTIVLRSGNIQNQTLQIVDDIVRVSGVKIADDKYIRDKDILMCARNGSARLVGKSCLIRNPEEKMTFGAFMTVIRTNYPYFLQGFFSSQYFKAQLTTVGTSSVNQITSKMLNNYSVIMPIEEDEKMFAEFVEQIDKSKFVFMYKKMRTFSSQFLLVNHDYFF